MFEPHVVKDRGRRTLPQLTSSDPALDLVGSMRKWCPNVDLLASLIRRCVPTNIAEEQQFAVAVAIAYEMGKSGMNGFHEGLVDRRAAKGTQNSIEKRQADADKRDRAAFYERWYEKRGRHLAAGREPKTSKEQLTGDIAATLPQDRRGSSEPTVLRAINRWERELRPG